MLRAEAGAGGPGWRRGRAGAPAAGRRRALAAAPRARAACSQPVDDAAELLSRVVDAHLAAPRDGGARRGAALDASSRVLDGIYDRLDGEIFFSKGGFVIPRGEKARIDASGGGASYGEVLPSGIDVLIRHLALDSSSVFVDLGAGRGTAVLQVALHSQVSRAVGLELSETRLEQAELALAALRAQGATLRPVEFQQADLSTCSLEEGTHFYLCSTAFGAAICRSIAERLAASPNFRALATSRALPTQPHLYKVCEVPCAYSYSASGRAYVYVKSPAAAPPGVLAAAWCADGACWLPSLDLGGTQLGLAADEPIGAPPARRFLQLRGRDAGSGGGGERGGEA
ncbi:d [Scenedesmus sp. PABB004]|nr:d [Scenedesmus sp. PABB004] [Scenedesmus sp. PABB004]